ncbi:hypothetical protein ANO14919_126650 [Xylariales sp. No.14919]|nr:hypothetical protein ANO14919_126650 [Xylariales sp. No.14919]
MCVVPRTHTADVVHEPSDRTWREDGRPRADEQNELGPPRQRTTHWAH